MKVLRALPDIDIYELIRKAEECMEQLLQVGVITHTRGERRSESLSDHR